MVLFVGPVAYLIYDLGAYALMLSMQNIMLRVPQGYSYKHWFFEPLQLKWHIIGMIPLVRYLLVICALAIGGTLQVIFLELQISYRLAVVMLVVQWGVNLVVMFVMTLGFNFFLGYLGQEQQPLASATAPQMIPDNERTAAATDTSAFLDNAKHHFQALLQGLDPYLEPIKQACKPLVDRLPPPVQQFLEGGGWWLVLGIIALVALLWLRRLTRRAGRVLSRPKAPRRRPLPKAAGLRLRENLSSLEESFTDPGPRQIVVKGVTARLRLVVMSPGTKDLGDLHPEIVSNILDWIQPHLGEVATYDCPGVRIWPPFFSYTGFTTAFANNLAMPKGRSQRSQWVLAAGALTMGRQKIYLGLALFTAEPTNLGMISVKNERWLDVLGVTAPAKVRT
jgi:hypothetical protein